ncbi:MAG TPA: right-handed parallel beta-helix repeat-containing protein [Planctomycetota bacterium]|nr:right-handed parallel beta-helix repeat-containing protein [Planctomycetota bacterium]
MRTAIALGALLLLGGAGAAAAGEKLEVGPGKKFEKVAAALKAAKDGDIIEIDAKGKYEKDVGYVKASNLTIRGVGEGRAVLDAQGTCAGSKGIFVTQGKDVTIENIEFRNAGGEVNAAGIRAEGENLTVRNCKFHDCRDALLGGKGEVLIEFSEFSWCGHNSDPATHNLYISQNVTKLTYRYNYSHHSREGHLLKTRAKESWLLYNRLSDEDGTGSAVADFPNGGVVVLVGNILHKGPKGQNNRPIAYGMEGIKHEKNALVVASNTIVWENRRAQEVGFVHVKNVPEGLVPVIRNNLCIGPLKLTTAPKCEESGNLIFKTAAEAGCVDPEKWDFRLKAGSPAIDKGVDPGKFGDFSVAPDLQYLHPAKNEKRPSDGKLDVGAGEFTPAK